MNTIILGTLFFLSYYMRLEMLACFVHKLCSGDSRVLQNYGNLIFLIALSCRYAGQVHL